jgi:hypothetical protein
LRPEDIESRGVVATAPALCVPPHIPGWTQPCGVAYESLAIMVPSQGEDTYLVLDDLGRVGRVWRERPPKRMLTSKPSSATYLTTSRQPSDAHRCLQYRRHARHFSPLHEPSQIPSGVNVEKGHLAVGWSIGASLIFPSFPVRLLTHPRNVYVGTSGCHRSSLAGAEAQARTLRATALDGGQDEDRANCSAV